MTNNLFVGGFPYETTETELSRLFRACGTVRGVSILLERGTGRSRGLAFVEMSTEAEARSAIGKLNGSTLGSRRIFVSEARPRERRPDDLAGKPGFVERRSGKDRRRADESRREGSFKPKKRWGNKPGFAGKKEWKKRPAFGGPKKDWSAKPGAGGDKRKEFGGKKKWKPGASHAAAPRSHGHARPNSDSARRPGKAGPEDRARKRWA
ncbi:MAG TPA: RNA-binding protein [Elusimicrobiota bacterium]|nr:RNA-binding protein [Elusimicrobiota bacterium]